MYAYVRTKDTRSTNQLYGIGTDDTLLMHIMIAENGKGLGFLSLLRFKNVHPYDVVDRIANRKESPLLNLWIEPIDLGFVGAE